MAHMTLPAAHSEADAQLAERIGRTLDLEEVHVFWTIPGAARSPRSTPAPAAESGTVERAGLFTVLSALIGRLTL